MFNRSAPPTTVKNDLAMGVGAMGAVGQITSARLGTVAVLGQESLARIGSGSFLVRTAIPLVSGGLRVLSPRLAHAHQTGASAVLAFEELVVRRVLGAAGFLAIGAGAIGYFIGPAVIGLIFDPEVAPTPGTTAILLGAAPILYSSMILAQLFVARRDSRSVTAMSFSALAVTGVLILPLSQAFGDVGAAAALALGYLVRVSVATVRIRSR